MLRVLGIVLGSGRRFLMGVGRVLLRGSLGGMRRLHGLEV